MVILMAAAQAGLVNHRTFHLLLEFLCIFIALGIAAFTHQVHPHLRGSLLLVLGVGYGYVGVLDLLRTISNLELLTGVPGVDARISGALWIAGRGLEGGIILTAVLSGNRANRIGTWHAFSSLLSLGLVALMLLLTEPTADLGTINLVISGVMLLALVLYIRRYWTARKTSLFWYMILILVLSWLAETLYIPLRESWSGTTGAMAAQALKALSFYAVHLGILRWGVRDPAELTFSALNTERLRLVERIRHLKDSNPRTGEQGSQASRLEQLTAQVSAYLVQPGGDLSSRLTVSLEQLAELLTLDYLGFMAVDESREVIESWTGYQYPGSELSNLSRIEGFPGLDGIVDAGRDVIVPSPDEAKAVLTDGQWKWWKRQGITGAFLLPLVSTRGATYILWGVNLGSPLNFQEGLLPRLRTTGEIFAGLVLHFQMERNLESERRRLEMLALTSPAGIVVLNTQGGIVYSNPRAREILGISRGQSPLSDPVMGVRGLDGTELEAHHLPFWQVQRKRTVLHDLRIQVRMEGRERVLGVNIAPLEDSSGDFDGAIAAVEDNTRDFQRQQQLRASRDQYRLLFSTMSEGFALHEIIVNTRGEPVDYRFLEVNPAMEGILGMPAAAVVGKTVLEILPRTEKHWIEEYGKVALMGESICFESYARELGRYFEVSAYQASPGQFATLTRDVTQLRQTFMELRAAKEVAEAANKTREEFLANVSHELRTPINGILGMLSLLREHDYDEETTNYLELLEQSGQNLFAIVEDLLDVNRLSRHSLRITPKPFQPSRVAQTCIHQVQRLAERKNLDLRYRDETQGVWMVGDEQRISQITLNLLTNGIKYTNSGYVSLEIRAKHGLEIQVQDSGIGIDNPGISRIFEPFAQLENPYTKTHQGIGMGLAVVQGLVDLMMGRISVDSKPGRGSTFLVELPLERHDPPREQLPDVPEHASPVTPAPGISRPEPQAGRPPAQSPETADLTPAPGRYQGRRVLLVEDEAINRLYIQRLLSAQGMIITEAGTGPAAAEQWQRSIDARQPFDLILMDVGLPGMNGMDVIAAMRKKEPGELRTRVCVLTAHAFPEDRNRFLSHGADYYLSKPIRRDTLFGLLDEIWA